MQITLTPDLLLQAYAQGLFPMAYDAQSPYIQWVCPDMRGQLSITDMHIPKRLARTVRQAPYEIRVNHDFAGVIDGCAAQTDNRPETWINQQIRDAFAQLYQCGHAHSVECWHDGALIGGVYGLSLGGAFFGESMFSRRRDASKIALVHLAARLWRCGYAMLDTQFVNDHLTQFGVYEIPFDDYQLALNEAVQIKADFLGYQGQESELIQAYFEWRKSR